MPTNRGGNQRMMGFVIERSKLTTMRLWQCCFSLGHRITDNFLILDSSSQTPRSQKKNTTISMPQLW
jgi:hypothetical protein